MTYHSIDEHKNNINLVNEIPPKPIPKHIQLGNIPDEMKKERRWACWRYRWDGKKWTKPPISAITLGNAKNNDASTWATYDAALYQYQQEANNLDGIGVMLGDGWAGTDIDYCITDGNISEAAQEVITLFNTYTEVSPSETGVKIFYKADIGKGRRAGPARING